MMTAVLMPITSPREDTSGPPELPGLSAASVWMTSSIMRPGGRAQRAPQRGNHARGHRGLEAKRIADGDRELAAPQLLGVAERRERQAARGIGAQERKVGVGIDAEQARLGGAAFGIGQANFARAVDDVSVGENKTVGRNDDARADPAASCFAVAARAYRRARRQDRRSTTEETASE